MKFNRLYLHGFKSFVDKTTVDFPDGITAIVGPNGSGKSNIMDAVRWVFGEQNAKELRGADMEDIVFNGSQKRKPAGFAEVGLTLSEIDEAVAAKYGTFSEITITRKFYKTGEREYYINNRKCRLKDIKDIFMDTGLGARSISIIEQGKVDKIINASPEELRFFLEETAGVTKFKDKKKEAEKRLQQTKDNLDRVTDIVEEIVTQMQSLSGQVEQLNIYEELQSNFKRLERAYLCTSYYTKAEDHSRITSLLIEKKQQLESLLAKYSEVIRQEAVVNEQYNTKQSEYEALQEKRVVSVTKKAKTEGDISALEAKIASSDSVKANLQESIKSNEARLEEAVDNIERLTDDMDTAGDSLEFITDKVEELKEVIEDIISQKESVEDEFEEADSEFLSLTEKITTKRNELIRIESTFDHTKAAIERLEREFNSLDTSMQETKEKQDILRDEFTDLEEKLNTTSYNYELLKENTESLKNELEDTKKKYTLEQAELKSLESNISFFEKQIEESSALNNEDTKFLREYNAELLIDILDIDDKTKLIDIGDVFVFNDEHKDIILDKVAGIKSTLRFAFKADLSLIKQNIDKLNINKSYNNIYFHNGIYKKAGDDESGVKIFKLKERLSEEKAKHEDISVSIISTKESLYKLESKYEEMVKDLEDAKKLFEETKNLAFKKEVEFKNIQEEYNRQSSRKSTIEKEIELTKDNLLEAEEKVSALREEVNDFAEQQVDCEERRRDLEDKLDNIKDSLDEKKSELTEVKIQQAQKEEHLNAIKRELETSRKVRDEVKANIEALREKLDKLLNVDEIAWQEELDTLKESLDDMQKDILSLEEEVKYTATQMEEIKQTIDEFKKQAESVNTEIKVSDDAVRKYELDIAGITSVLEAAAAQYMEKYGTELPHEYRTYAETDREPRKIKEEMNKLESKLDDLGPINLNAINDYKEAEERYNFLTSQRDDLEGSIADIQAFISETDEATVNMFTETFNSVKDKFVEVFHILFGNGEAELKLTDPDNMLTSGVEIYIQPPGKKLQHMGLLSGGEKALTAMTLLFALFLQKPTPFCFLDEVDAPLDDANVERYVSMVKALSDKTQFILITHNHNTMSIANSIYGVAMQEYGVSSILSVTLEQVARAGR